MKQFLFNDKIIKLEQRENEYFVIVNDLAWWSGLDYGRAHEVYYEIIGRIVAGVWPVLDNKQSREAWLQRSDTDKKYF